MLERKNERLDVLDYEWDFEDLVICKTHKERLTHTEFPQVILENSRLILNKKFSQSKLFRETFKEFEEILESCKYDIEEVETGESLPIYDEDDNIVDEFPVTYYKVVDKETRESVTSYLTPTKARAYVFLYDLLDYSPKYFSMYHELNTKARTEKKRESLTLPWVKTTLGEDKVPSGIYLVSFKDTKEGRAYTEYVLYLNEGDKVKDDIYTDTLVKESLSEEQYKDPNRRLLKTLELNNVKKEITESGIYYIDTSVGLAVEKAKGYENGEVIYLCNIDESPFVESEYCSMLDILELNR